MKPLAKRVVVLALAVTLPASELSPVMAQAADDGSVDFGTVFDEHWIQLRDNYPYFDLYGVDWEAERAEHRPRAVVAADPTEFAWEMARLIASLDDPHVEYMPPIPVMKDWSIPDVRTAMIGRKPYIVDWKEYEPLVGPPPFDDDPRVCPEVVSVQGTPMGSAVDILVAGPVGTTCELRLRWPDGSETDHDMPRPEVSNLPPPKKHFGERWIVTGRVGSIGYLRVKTFDPSRGTLGPAGKMTPILRGRLAELSDTDALILDLQRNGGGLVGASDPFLCHFLERRRSYRWGNSGGQSRVLVPRSPPYTGAVVVLVDEHSASGGEWAARILRDAGRAQVVGGPTVGAEAAVQKSTATDGSTVRYSAWPMEEPGVTPFQGRGVELDHAVPLTIEAVREHGYDDALARVRRARFAKALEVLGAPAGDLDALVALADDADREDER